MTRTGLARTEPFRDRRDVASGEVRSEAGLIRLALSPEGRLVPDPAARAPGRGVWVAADRASVAKALKKGAFARSLQQRVETGEDLAADIEAALARSALSLISLSRRAGELTSGFDKVRASLKKTRPGCLITARDGAADGRAKLLALSRAQWGDIPIADRLTSAELGVVLGRDSAVHMVMSPGGLAARFAMDAARLAGFRNGPAETGAAAKNG